MPCHSTWPEDGLDKPVKDRIAVARRPCLARRLPAPTLAAVLVDELDDEVTAHLKSSFGDQRGVRVVTDANIRTSMVPKGRVEVTPDGPIVLSEGSHVAWARGWGAYNETGYLARVILQVVASEPPVVHVYVNGNSVLSRVPDWIANRGTGADEADDHSRFKRVVLEAICGAVSVGDREPDLD